ncbi:DUF58 domain-containing protein [Microbulbifer sp. 2205BS26-8]|uniref:DUF58 domain-containing protein n=1 Tax=Microbulbifer sp. 2205BS26-8 TaxID=3064386 RepID=UPI00273E54C3|nr:DUF58 domain-containing protein [Microbulbifer sp. 2205BS26-8]MDP5209943.1 DUF58 domain-containing protein [Microbulbifer sp. 2205BS26-8]
MSVTRNTAGNPFRALAERWLNRRAPRARAIALNHRRLFILPTRAGLGFLLMIALLWLLATNYENNLVFALTFLLVSAFVILPVHTFANLTGLHLQLLGTRPAFAGDFTEANINVRREGKRKREWIQLGWPPEEGRYVDLCDQAGTDVCIAMPVVARGRVQAPRLRIESRFPLGLFCCWSWLDLDIEFLVYPRPVSAGPLPVGAAQSEGESGEVRRGHDDLNALKPYQPGDSLRHLAWKQYAAGRDLYSKEYESRTDGRLWLDWELLDGRDVETRLSNLCHWVLQAERQQLAYGLRLPGTRIAPALGPKHQQQVLRALALFPKWGS